MLGICFRYLDVIFVVVYPLRRPVGNQPRLHTNKDVEVIQPLLITAVIYIGHHKKYQQLVSIGYAYAFFFWASTRSGMCMHVLSAWACTTALHCLAWLQIGGEHWPMPKSIYQNLHEFWYIIGHGNVHKHLALNDVTFLNMSHHQNYTEHDTFQGSLWT